MHTFFIRAGCMLRLFFFMLKSHSKISKNDVNWHGNWHNHIAIGYFPM